MRVIMFNRAFEICDIVHTSQHSYSMTKEEMIDYLSVRNIAPAPDVIERLFAETNGWACAVHLASSILEQKPDAKNYVIDVVKSKMKKTIETGFLAELDSDLNRLLIKISLIIHPYTSLLSQILEPDMFKKLEKLAEKNVLICYDKALDCFLLHPMLVNLLTEKHAVLTEDEIQNVLRPAASWCMERGFLIDTIRYYVKLGDYRTFLDIAFDLSLATPTDVLEAIIDIIENMPQSVLEQDDRGYIMYSRLLMHMGRTKDAADFIVGKLNEFDKLPDSEYKNRLYFGLYNNLGFISMIQSLYTGVYDFAKHFKMADAFYRKCDLPGDRAIISLSLGPFVCRVGNRHKNEFSKYISALKDSSPYVANYSRGTMSGLYELAVCEFAYYTGDMDSCEKVAYRCINIAKIHQQYEIENRALFYLLRRSIFSGKIDEIKEIHERINSIPFNSDYPERYKLRDVVTSWFSAQIKQTDQVAYWIKRDNDEKDINYIRRGVEFFTRVKYLHLNTQHRQLLALLESEDTDKGMASFLLGRIGIYLYRAICYYHLKNSKATIKAFEEAYRLARANAIIAVFVEAGNDMRSLCSFALKYGHCTIPEDWLKMINAKASTYSKYLAQVEMQFVQHDKDGVSLTKAECVILTKLSKGMSRVEIANENNISTNTVKTIINDAIGKLGAQNAVEAVSIALRKELIH